ncbi:MAG TPA: hypothetical protein VND93_29150 [Myxococcales bacterium]|nr:hypothetical protein [Myxococcales bacterium]
MATTTTVPDRVAPEPTPERTFATPVERLSGLLRKAEGATGEARRAAAAELNALVTQLARFPSRPVADLLLRWLDEGALAGLEDADGQTSRAAVTAGVLTMGYPYALEISPDDLDHLRERSAARGSLGGTLAAFLVVAVTSGYSALEMLAESRHGHPSEMTSVLAVLAVAGSVVAMALSRPRAVARRWALLSLLLSGLMSMSLAMAGASSLLLPAIGAVVAFGMAWPRRGS